MGIRESDIHAKEEGPRDIQQQDGPCESGCCLVGRWASGSPFTTDRLNDRGHSGEDWEGECDCRLHAVRCAAGYDLRWLLGMIAKRGLLAVLWLSAAQVPLAVQAMFGTARAPEPSECVLPFRSAA